MKKFSAAALAALILCGPVGAQTTSRWQLQEGEDSLTDVRGFAAATEGDGVSAFFWCSPTTGVRLFAVRTSPVDYEMGQFREVIWRVDREPAVTSSWANGERGGAAAFDDEAIQIADAIRRASDRFVVRSGGETVTYSVAGSTQAIGAAFEGCGITVPDSQTE